MSVYQRIPLAVYFALWAAGALGWASLMGDDLLTSTFAVLGAFGLIVVSIRSAVRLGRRRAAETIVMASSVGPWVALISPKVQLAAALIISVSVSYLALYLRAELPELRRDGLLVAFGLKGARPRRRR